MKTIDSVKKRVGQLVDEKGLKYNRISLLLGKNPTYLQKFIKEKSPQRLDESFRKGLSQILEVDEQELTDIPLLKNTLITPYILDSLAFSEKKIQSDNNIISIDILDVTACCGNGLENISENVCGQWVIPVDDFRGISLSSNPQDIKMLRVRGDSMEPTLKDGDWVLTDMSRQNPESDGMYLLRLSTGLAVKRLQGSAIPDAIKIISDNPIYDVENARLSDITILGRIIYTLRAEKVG